MNMKRIMIIAAFIVLNAQIIKSQITGESVDLSNQLNNYQNDLSEIKSDIGILKRNSAELYSKYQLILDEHINLCMLCDSLHNEYTILCEILNDNRKMALQRICETQKNIAANKNIIENRTMYGIIIVISLIIVIVTSIYYLRKGIKKRDSSIDEVRKAQKALQNAQTKMEEESIKLDNKLLEIAEQQIKTTATINNQGTADVDHSLALKVADEIVRIELNLSRMDSSIKGYKQLAKAVQRIKDNFQANGYEFVDMLGKPYNEGMKVIANFVSDETLERGKQIITGIVKPQINYNGKMIQSAQITVSQNI